MSNIRISLDYEITEQIIKYNNQYYYFVIKLQQNTIIEGKNWWCTPMKYIMKMRKGTGSGTASIQLDIPIWGKYPQTESVCKPKVVDILTGIILKLKWSLFSNIVSNWFPILDFFILRSDNQISFNSETFHLEFICKRYEIYHLITYFYPSVVNIWATIY